DYVLPGYGTGAVMGVPAHDQRDFEFARAMGLPIRRVIAPREAVEERSSLELEEAYLPKSSDDVLIDSGPYTGLSAPEGARAITVDLEVRGQGRASVTYRLRDWLVSRQRYWGTPIPVVYCASDGVVPVPEDQLPVVLPEDAEFAPTGESPLKSHAGFLNTECPRCGGPATRETDTMDTFVDSSWYWYRYLSPHLADAPLDRALVDAWCPVDQYTGGSEHAVMHLLYSRFFTKALADMGLVGHREPFARLFNQGQILGADGERMSKSRGNVQDPDELVGRYGADTVRLFLMFMGPWDQGGPWNSEGISGLRRFLNRVWTVTTDAHGREPGDPESGRLPAGEDAAAGARALRVAAHRALQQVTADHDGFRWNTMIARLMELTNLLMRYRGTEVAGRPEWDEAERLLTLMLAPIAPHIAEELWGRRLASAGQEWRSIHTERWPAFEEALVAEDTIELPVQVNGKLRDRVPMRAGLSEAEIEALVLEREKIRALLDGHRIVRIVHVAGRLVNIVVRRQD
ncbi:MAG: leucine--tRNA ligase, partial [Chloroflexi bacterium]|nr:leucine--tRNA ligase [Chloroflexota bacterium]